MQHFSRDSNCIRYHCWHKLTNSVTQLESLQKYETDRCEKLNIIEKMKQIRDICKFTNAPLNDDPKISAIKCCNNLVYTEHPQSLACIGQIYQFWIHDKRFQHPGTNLQAISFQICQELWFTDITKFKHAELVTCDRMGERRTAHMLLIALEHEGGMVIDDHSSIIKFDDAVFTVLI